MACKVSILVLVAFAAYVQAYNWPQHYNYNPQDLTIYDTDGDDRESGYIAARDRALNYDNTKTLSKLKGYKKSSNNEFNNNLHARTLYDPHTGKKILDDNKACQSKKNNYAEQLNDDLINEVYLRKNQQDNLGNKKYLQNRDLQTAYLNYGPEDYPTLEKYY